MVCHHFASLLLSFSFFAVPGPRCVRILLDNQADANLRGLAVDSHVTQESTSRIESTTPRYIELPDSTPPGMPGKQCRGATVITVLRKKSCEMNVE